MIACSPIKTCVKHIIGPTVIRQHLMPQSASLGFFRTDYVAKIGTRQSLAIKSRMRLGKAHQGDNLVESHNMYTRFVVPKQGFISRTKWHLLPGFWTAGLLAGLLVCNSASEPVHAEVKVNIQDKPSSSTTNFSHEKQVYTDYSVIEIPADGRCLFRAVAHGACIRSGKAAPNESLQRELADELRARVADEFVKRRKETEWFIEGDFDSYVSKIRKTHVWGGEPELHMASHVLKMPISVYMNDEDSGGLICIAEYGHEYGKENPIKVLYHGFGHYDALHVPGINDPRSRL